MLFSEGIILPPRPAFLLFVVSQPYAGPLQPKFQPFIAMLARSINRPAAFIHVRNVHDESPEEVLEYIRTHRDAIDAIFWFGTTAGPVDYRGPQHRLASMEETIMDRQAKIRLWKALKPHKKEK